MKGNFPLPPKPHPTKKKTQADDDQTTEETEEEVLIYYSNYDEKMTRSK